MEAVLDRAVERSNSLVYEISQKFGIVDDYRRIDLALVSRFAGLSTSVSADENSRVTWSQSIHGIRLERARQIAFGRQQSRRGAVSDDFDNVVDCTKVGASFRIKGDSDRKSFPRLAETLFPEQLCHFLCLISNETLDRLIESIVCWNVNFGVVLNVVPTRTIFDE